MKPKTKLLLHQAKYEQIYINITSLNKTEADAYIQAAVLATSIQDFKNKFEVPVLDDLKVDFYTESKGVIHQIIITGAKEILESREFKSNATGSAIILELSHSP